MIVIRLIIRSHGKSIKLQGTRGRGRGRVCISYIHLHVWKYGIPHPEIIDNENDAVTCMSMQRSWTHQCLVTLQVVKLDQGGALGVVPSCTCISSCCRFSDKGPSVTMVTTLDRSRCRIIFDSRGFIGWGVWVIISIHDLIWSSELAVDVDNRSGDAWPTSRPGCVRGFACFGVVDCASLVTGYS